jgi:hypothetical protein
MCRDFVKSFLCNLEEIGEDVANLLVITRNSAQTSQQSYVKTERIIP